jgi:hypothetical protein
VLIDGIILGALLVLGLLAAAISMVRAAQEAIGRG